MMMEALDTPFGFFSVSHHSIFTQKRYPQDVYRWDIQMIPVIWNIISPGYF